MSPVQDSIADLINTIMDQFPDEADHLIDVRTTSQNACIALQGIEDRQSEGTQYLSNIDVLFRRTAGMLDILETVLQDHVAGMSGGEMQDTVSSLSTVFEVFRKTANLVILYNET